MLVGMFLSFSGRNYKSGDYFAFEIFTWKRVVECGPVDSSGTVYFVIFCLLFAYIAAACMFFPLGMHGGNHFKPSPSECRVVGQCWAWLRWFKPGGKGCAYW